MNANYLVDPTTLAFRLKVQWFSDLLSHAETRRFLWSLYWAGEAYEELHPSGVFINRLEPNLGRLLARHLSDETRHARLFEEILAAENATPEPLAGEYDLGWYLLTHVAPDIVTDSSNAPFTPDQTIRYMAFLHALELRSITDLCALIEAAAQRGEAGLAAALGRILRDEMFHASYTHAAVFRLSANADGARDVLRTVLGRERVFYNRALNRILDRFNDLHAAPHTLLGKLRWTAMTILARLGLAVPRLPLYMRMPRHILNAAPAY